MKRLFYNRVFLILFPILVWQLYAYTLIPTVICKMAGFLGTFLLLILGGKQFFNGLFSRDTIKTTISLIILCAFITWFTSLVFWNQNFLASFRGSSIVLSLAFFFYLVNGKFSKQDIIRMVIILGILYTLLWIYAILSSPKIIFGYIGMFDSDEYVINRGLARIELNGSNFQVLLYFYALVESYVSRKKLLWIPFTFILFILTCASMTRFKIAVIILVTLYFILFRESLNFKKVFLGILGILLLFGIVDHFLHDYVEILTNLTTTQFSGQVSKEDDGMYRLKEYIFYFRDFKNNFITMIFGNGFPNSSSLQNYINLLKIKGYYPDDVSYAAVYIYMGFWGLYLYFKLFWTLVKQKVSQNMDFAKLGILFIVLSSFTLMNVFDSIAIATCSYLFFIDKFQKKGIVK